MGLPLGGGPRVRVAFRSCPFQRLHIQHTHRLHDSADLLLHVVVSLSKMECGRIGPGIGLWSASPVQIQHNISIKSNRGKNNCFIKIWSVYCLCACTCLYTTCLCLSVAPTAARWSLAWCGRCLHANRRTHAALQHRHTWAIYIHITYVYIT